MNKELIKELKSFAEYYEYNGNYRKADEIDELIRTAASKPWYKNPATYLSALGLMVGPTVVKDIKSQSPATGLSYSTPESYNADVDKFNRIKDKDNQQDELEYSAQQIKNKPQQTKPQHRKPTLRSKIQKGNFNKAIDKMLNLEGGKTYEKSDRGGKTNFGITQRTFNTWRDSINKPRGDVFTISQEEAKEIYKKNYWDLIKGSQLPHDIAQAILSMALTDGPQDAIKHTQKILGIPPTGVMGPITMKSIWSAAKQKGTKKLTNYIVDKQIQRYQSDEQAKTYGRGWTNRAESLRPK
jgi:hypothetical protein